MKKEKSVGAGFGQDMKLKNDLMDAKDTEAYHMKIERPDKDLVVAKYINQPPFNGYIREKALTNLRNRYPTHDSHVQENEQ